MNRLAGVVTLIATALAAAEAIWGTLGVPHPVTIAVLFGGFIFLATQAMEYLRRRLSDHPDLGVRRRRLLALDATALAVLMGAAAAAGWASAGPPAHVQARIRSVSLEFRESSVPTHLLSGSRLISGASATGLPGASLDVVLDLVNEGRRHEAVTDLVLAAYGPADSAVAIGYTLVDVDSTRANPVINLAPGEAARHQVRFFAPVGGAAPGPLDRLALMVEVGLKRHTVAEWSREAPTVPR